MAERVTGSKDYVVAKRQAVEGYKSDLPEVRGESVGSGSRSKWYVLVWYGR
jgi:hypothetical protein